MRGLLGVCLRRWVGFASQSLGGLATTVRDAPTGKSPAAKTSVVGYGLRPSRDTPDTPRETSPSSRLRCRGWVRLGTVMRSRRRSRRSFTASPTGRWSDSVARLFALRGATFDCASTHSVVAPQTSRWAPAPHELPFRGATGPRRSTVNPADSPSIGDGKLSATSAIRAERATSDWFEVPRRNARPLPRMLRPAGQARALKKCSRDRLARRDCVIRSPPRSHDSP